MLMKPSPTASQITDILLAFYLAGCGGYSSSGSGNGNGPVAPYITTQPANQTVTAGQTATFSVTASGTAALNYRWQKNGADITGATSASYTTPATTTSDSGSTFAVVVTNTAGPPNTRAPPLTPNPRPGAAALTPPPRA